MIVRSNSQTIITSLNHFPIHIIIEFVISFYLRSQLSESLYISNTNNQIYSHKTQYYC